MEKRDHKVTINNRAMLSITDIKEVDSFDEKEIRAKLTQGALLIRGEKLNITKLELQEGICEICGVVDSLMYIKAKEKSEKSIIAKIMK